MAFAHPDQLDALLSAMAEQSARDLDAGGLKGCLARALPLQQAQVRWVMSEATAGNRTVFLEAACLMAGSLIASAAMNAAKPGCLGELMDAAVALARQQAFQHAAEGPQFSLDVVRPQ